MLVPELSVVIPCYNESERLEPMFQQWISTLEGTVPSFEIIAINDGSIDGTGRALDRLRKDYKSLRVIHQLNMGPTGAIRRGCEVARGHFVLFVTSDERYEPADFVRMWELRKDSIQVMAHRTHRIDSLFSRGWNELTKKLAAWIFGVGLEDPSSWFRLLRRDVLQVYLNIVPKSVQSLPLALSYLIKKDHPTLVAECPIHFGVAKRIQRRKSISRQLSNAAQELFEIVALRRISKGTAPSVAPSPETLAS